WAFVDGVFPPAVEKGKAHIVELLGSGLRVDVGPAKSPGVLPVLAPQLGIFSGPRPFVRISPHAEIIKQAMPGKVQDIQGGPIGVSGRLLTAFDEDRYRVPVTPKTK